MRFLKLSWIDYAMLIIVISVSSIFGIYFGCFRKQNTTKDYFLGGKKMRVFPITMSLVASTLSGITLIALPAEVYMYGTQVSLLGFSIIIVCIITNYVYLPVFYKIQCASAYEYFELRFDKTIKNIASLFFSIKTVLFLPVIVYAPSLAFNQVSGFNVHITAPVMVIICIFYTSLGGLKAVVWNDTLQISITLITLSFILIMGTISVGGFSTVWETARAGDRLEFFNINVDPTIRSTFWTVFIGNIFHWSSLVSVNPSYVQRYLSMASLKNAKKTLMGFGVLAAITKSISCFFGLIMYTKYFNCDPLSAGYIKKADQILPYYVLEEASKISGINGLFIAGLFCTAFSTMSTNVNTLSGIWYTDFLVPYFLIKTSDEHAGNIMKLISIVIGGIVIGLVFVVEKFGSIFETYQCINGISEGAIFGLFTLGMLFPFANRKGAIIGALSSLLLMSIIIINNRIYIWNGTITYSTKVLQTYGCNLTTTRNISLATIKPILTNNNSLKEPLWLYRISFYYFCGIGILSTIVIGALISWITQNKNEPPINTDLLSPCVHRSHYTNRNTRYSSVEIELHCMKS